MADTQWEGDRAFDRRTIRDLRAEVERLRQEKRWEPLIRAGGTIRDLRAEVERLEEECSIRSETIQIFREENAKLETSRDALAAALEGIVSHFRNHPKMRPTERQIVEWEVLLAAHGPAKETSDG